MTIHRTGFENLGNPSHRYGRTEHLSPEAAVAIMPSKVMETIVESAKVQAEMEDLMIRHLLEAQKESTLEPRKEEFNPSRRDSS